MKEKSLQTQLEETDSYIMGLDIGGTKIEAVLLHATREAPVAQNNEQVLTYQHQKLNQTHSVHLRILSRERVPTEREKGYEYVVEKIVHLLAKTCEEGKIPWEKISFIGIGMPGSVDPVGQRMLNGNSFIFIEKDLTNDLRRKLPLTTSPLISMRMENDANCFTLAEVFCGVGPLFFKETNIPIGEQLGIGVILGTGCGGGAVLKGQLLRGRKGGAMEAGHIQLVSNGKACYCGRQGCSEGVISGSGLEDSYLKMGKKHLAASEIFNKARLGDFYALRIVQNYSQYLDQLLVNLCNLFDPDYIVLGGGLSKEEKIYDGTEDRIRKQIFLAASSPRLYRHQLGDSAGVIGAALLNFH